MCCDSVDSLAHLLVRRTSPSSDDNDFSKATVGAYELIPCRNRFTVKRSLIQTSLDDNVFSTSRDDNQVSMSWEDRKFLEIRKVECTETRKAT